MVCYRIRPIIRYPIQVVVTAYAFALCRVESPGSASSRGNFVEALGSSRIVWSPMGAALKSPKPVQLPSPKRCFQETLTVKKKGKIPSVSEGESMPHIIS